VHRHGHGCRWHSGGSITPAAVRWGILATGRIAGLFTEDLLLTGHSVVAVGSRSRQSAARFAAQFGISRAHGSYEELVADPEVDVVYVATPHPLHAENAIAALQAGKHVLVEKAFTMNAAEAEKVVSLARRKGLIVLEAMWTRFLPHMMRIREIVASGSLGEVRAVIADHMQHLSDDPAHRLNDLRLGGGALLDLGIYPISLAWDILGEPRSISTTARFKASGADAQVAVTLRHAGEAISTVVAASDAVGSNTATVIGSRGRIAIDSFWYKPTTFRVYDDEGDVIEEFKSSVTGRGRQYQAVEVERLIASGKTAGDILPPGQSVAIMRTLDAIRAQIGLRYPGE
jgi:predicted dehydrogenase